ncbi:MAG TPA: response regulator [Nitrospiraceae bacterium]|nr:response regulator [Nitrospiraceae bacterium]
MAVLPSRPLRILLAEDSTSNRVLLQAFLQNTPHQVDLAANGQVAVEMFQAVLYDLVFMDMEMPVMDGCSATRKIRAWEQVNHRPPTPIFALTAHRTEREQQKSLAAGCTAHLTKPIKKDVFLQALHVNSDVSRALHILLAEDSTSSRIFIQTYFKGTPHQLDLVENGLLAVEQFKTGRYDLVLMDLEMPEMDGFAATKAIRRWETDQGVQSTPIIALTAYDFKQNAQKIMDAGCTSYLSKPIPKSALLATISEYTAR